MLTFRATSYRPVSRPALARFYADLERVMRFADPTTESIKIIHRIADQLTAKFTTQFIGAIDTVKLSILKQQLIDALLRSDVASAISAMPWRDITTTLTPMIETALSQAVVKTATALMTPNDARFGLRFDITNPRAADFARSRAAELVTRITQDTRLVLRDLIDRAFVEGIPPAKAARLIEQHIGLLPQHAKAVENLRKRLLADGKSLAQVEKLTAQYTKNLLRYRAENIARYEIMSASNQGQDALWRERAANGLLDLSVAKRKWIATRINACPICIELNGKVAAFGESFPGGYEMPPAHPSCRCTLGITED